MERTAFLRRRSRRRHRRPMEHSRAPHPQGTGGESERPYDRLWLDHLAKVDRAGFLDRLANGCLARSRASHERSSVGDRECTKLDGARQAVIQSRPTLLDSHGNVEIGESHEKRTENAANSHVKCGARERDQQGCPYRRVEVEQPVGEPRQDHQRDDQCPGTQGSPWSASRRLTDVRRARIRDSNWRAVISRSPDTGQWSVVSGQWSVVSGQWS